MNCSTDDFPLLPLTAAAVDFRGGLEFGEFEDSVA